MTKGETGDTVVDPQTVLHAIMDEMYDPYIEIDVAGTITFANESTCRHLGYARSELVGKNFSVIIPPEENAVTFQAYKDVLASGQPHKGYAHRVVRKDGGILFAEASINLRRNERGEVAGFRTISRDITERMRLEEEIRALSFADHLTGLNNRRGFLSLAEQQMKLANRSGRGMLLCFADLDGLKVINDTLGHQIGDRALVEVALALRETFRTSDIPARLGGDEFAVLIVDIEEANFAIVTERLRHVVDRLNSRHDRGYWLSISVGWAYYDPQNPCSIDELMARADKLMYEQKQNKKAAGSATGVALG